MEVSSHLFTAIMGGFAWSETETVLVIYNTNRGLEDYQLVDRMKKAGFNRTIVAIRSKISQLRGDPTVYDANQNCWIEGEIRRRILSLPSEDQSLFVCQNSKAINLILTNRTFID